MAVFLGSIPGVGGVLDKAGGLADKVGLGGIVQKPAKPEDAIKDKIKHFVTEGYPIGRIGLFFLAGCIPVAPFSFLGYGAVNLMVAGSKGWAAAKAALQMAFVLANKFLGAYYPKLWWVGWLLVLNPWYVFDLVQLFDAEGFERDGFKVPFYGEQIRPTDGVYKLNGIVIGIMLALLTAGGFSLLDYLPPEVVGGAKPALELALKVIGGVTAAAGGGLGLLMLPSLKQTIVEGVAGVKSEAAAAAAAAPVAAVAPGTLPAVAAPAPAAQKGGSGQGGVIPSLREIAAGLLGPAPGGDPGPFKSTVITGGGGAADTSSILFVGTLGLAALGGIALAVTRSKGDSLA